MCFLPEFNDTGYFGSLVISHLVKWLKANTDYLFLYTLADAIMGEMRLCVSGQQLPLYRQLYHQRLPGQRDRGKDTPRSARLLLEENAAGTVWRNATG